MRSFYVVTLILCFTTIHASEESTTSNELYNSVESHENDLYQRNNIKTYGQVIPNNDVISPSTPEPIVQENIQPMPTTGCFGNPPQDNNVNNFDKTIQNNAFEPIVPQNQPRQFSEQIPSRFGHNSPMYHPIYNRNQPPFYPHFYHGFHPQNHWSPYRYSGPQQIYPWRRQMPFVMPPTAPELFPQSGHRPPVIIVKLLQPIILPIAKPYYPEGGDRDPDSEDVDKDKYMNTGFQKYMNGGMNRFNSRNFGRNRHYERSLTLGENNAKSFGPYKLNTGNGENIHISVKLN